LLFFFHYASVSHGNGPLGFLNRIAQTRNGPAGGGP
jgi:hypothetical protein